MLLATLLGSDRMCICAIINISSFFPSFQELVKEVDPNEVLDEDVEDMLLHIADDFLEQTVVAACQMAKHRRATNIEVKDVQLVLGENGDVKLLYSDRK